MPTSKPSPGSETAVATPSLLEEKWSPSAGLVYLSGQQALIRALLTQARRDEALGLKTAGFVSGYRGSPLAGLDTQLMRTSAHLDAHAIHFEPGINEELAATAVHGSQQVGLSAGARYEGVFGLWYGKAPGFDRAADAIRHAHSAGVSRNGGVLAVVGDDHACKSSSLPSQSEFLFEHLEMPVLAPASVQDVLDHALLGWAMSRYSGGWVGLIALADFMDASAVIDGSASRAAFVTPSVDSRPLGGLSIRSGHDPLALEVRTRHGRRAAAQAFARANGVDRVVFDSTEPRLVVLASGKGFADTRQAFDALGIDEANAQRLGVRLIQIGMPWPLDTDSVREWTRGADKVLVVEEKRAFIETQLRDALYGLRDEERPRIVGKRGGDDRTLLSDVFELSSAEIARALVDEWVGSELTPEMHAHMAARSEDMGPIQIDASPTRRAPFFCSGCPHSRSTRLPEGSRGLVGIGCHYMVQWMDRNHDQVCQMGGEGAAWIGQAPFTDEKHVFANLGDGTYLHSGLLAIRAAVAARVSITYKLLFNDAVAMTGGQAMDAPLDVPTLTRQLAAEGVARVVVVAEDPSRHDGEVGLAPGVLVEPRERLDAVQRELRDLGGVSVLVYDQACATEVRRKRKRGLAPAPDRRVFIHEGVCEGCGDCSRASNCLSVVPVETDHGRKRRIDQSSCNVDGACVDGACPSFVSVVGGTPRRSRIGTADSLLGSLPEPPAHARSGACDLVLAGIGGTGITTTAALLGWAAHLEGRRSSVLDMTGLAQKGGAVLSHVRIAGEGEEIFGGRVPEGGAQVLLAADPVVAVSEPALALVGRDRTQAVVNRYVAPTSEFVSDPDAQIDEEDLQRRIALSSRGAFSLDATTICERALGESVFANTMLLGVAYQRGLLPLSADSLKRAIVANGQAVEANLRAFGLGRLQVHDVKRLEDHVGLGEPLPPPSLEETIERRVSELIDYQSVAYADRYNRWVNRARALQERLAPDDDRFVRGVALGAFKLMACKDEFEVARLYVHPSFEQSLRRQFEGRFRVRYHFAPPLLSRRSVTGERPAKWSLGGWVWPLLWLLAKARRVRGSWLDPFRAMPERRLERELLDAFEGVVDAACTRASNDTLDDWSALIERAEAVRGFDHVRSTAAEPVLRAWSNALAFPTTGGDAPDQRP